MANLTWQSVRQALRQRGLLPQTRLARFALVTGAFTAAFALMGVRTLGFWFSLAATLFTGSLLLLGGRWFQKHFMWRLRNRLIVTYVFIGVIPLVLLATMGVVAGFLFAGQFSTFVITTDVNSELRRLESANRTITHQLAHRLRNDDHSDLAELPINNEVFPGRQVTAYYQGAARNLPGGTATEELSAPPANVTDAAITVDHGDLYLRAVNRVRITEKPGDELLVVSSVPLDMPTMESVVSNMGLINLLLPSERSVQQSSDEAGNDGRVDFSGSHPKLTCGAVPPAVSRLDVQFRPFPIILNSVRWSDGRPGHVYLTVSTRPSLLYYRLFRTLGEMTNFVLMLLVVIAFVFAFIEVAALIVGVRLTRTMTSSVAKLYEATEYVNRGDLSHRIQINSRDQLAALESSFNSMTGSLQKLIAEQKEKQRIESELQIAKEVQDLLFPHDAADLDGLELHGICLPARTVSGDYYDFLPVGDSAVGLAVGDISGKGISAALMMATVHAFVRAHTLTEPMTAMAADREPVLRANGDCCPAPGTVLALLNQQLFRSTPAQKYATMFLGFYDQPKRRFTYSNAGHLPPMVICADGTVQRLEQGGTVVGLFSDMSYPEGCVTLNPGDILVAFSDGITEPENDFGEFGEARLARLVQENRELPLPRISDAVLNAVVDWIGGEEQPDDMTIVIARAR
jgi:sigma-B regulation protein RsbU (phosphoserine phosphatase)